jgi:chorismate lyase/3-hydroxybenzoate synthase
MSVTAVTERCAAALKVEYRDVAELAAILAEPQVLAVIGFGAGAVASASTDPRYFQVGLQPATPGLIEVWYGTAPVRCGRAGELAWAHSDDLAFAALEVDEAAHGGIEAAAEYAYHRLGEHLAGSGRPHLLRIWNYLDAIVEGEGDDERYRRFCVGRARGIGAIDTDRLPAATAIGRRDGVRRLQLYWLASGQPGTPVENPRQVSAYHYPRQYGPQSPSFARAMLAAPGSGLPLLLSGTASVVGHQTRHAGQPLAQLEEIFSNITALLASARQQQSQLPAQLGAQARLKVYVSAAADLPAVAQMLSRRLDVRIPHLLLHGEVCRRDLAVEIDGVHG